MLLSAQILLRLERKPVGAALAQRRIHLIGKARVFVGEAARDLVPEDRGMALAQAFEAARQLELVRAERAPRILERLAHFRLHAIPFVGSTDADARRSVELRFQVAADREGAGGEDDVLYAAAIHAHRVEPISARLHSGARNGVV